MTKTLAVIPARGGSKAVPRKNIKLLAGKPLIAYTIEAALACKGIDRLIVSSDDEEILEVARQYGAETPFVRPAALAQDDSPDRPVFQHAVNFLEKQENYIPDFILMLRPTAPFRSSEDIDNAILKWKQTNSDSVRSVCRVEGVHHPYWMFQKDEQDIARPLIEGVSIDKYYRRQLLPPVYRLNGVVDGFTRATLLHHEKLYGDKMALIEIPEDRAFDIDTMADFEYAQYLATTKN
jgi:CMP-N,N'-diacetyllegionaminic acid synthase